MTLSGNYEPVGEQEYRAAIVMAEAVVNWASAILKQNENLHEFNLQRRKKDKILQFSD